MGLFSRIFGAEPADIGADLRRLQARAHVRMMLAQQSGAKLSHDPRIASVDIPASHPILRLKRATVAGGLEHATQLLIFHLIREFVPTVDQALSNRRALEGDVEATSEDEGLQEAINTFIEEIPVGYLSGRAVARGLNAYLDMLADGADEYGLAAGEMLTDARGRELERLVVPNPRTLELRDEDRDGFFTLHQRQQGQTRRLDDSPLVHTLQFRQACEGPWPPPLVWSLIKSSEVVIRIYESVANAWWRFGDPSIFYGIEYDRDATPETVDFAATMPDGTTEQLSVPAALLRLKQSVEAVMQARREGRVGDVYAAADGGKLRQEVIGEIDSALMRYFREQSTYFDGLVVGASETPVWMYPHIQQQGDGLGSARSNNQAMIYAVAARKRNEKKARLAREVIDTWLLLQGEGRFVGRYELAFSTVNLLDDQVEAQTRETNARADATRIENVVQLYDEDGTRRFSGEAERMLEEEGLYPS